MSQFKALIAGVSVYVLSASILWATQQPVCAQSPSPLLPEIASLEKTVYGKTTDGKLIDRVQHLEETTFGVVQTGAINTRIHALQRVFESPSGSGGGGLKGKPVSASHSEAASEASSEAASEASGYSANRQRVVALLKAGVDAEGKNDDAAARQDFENVTKIDPGNVDAYFNLGALAEKGGDLKMAYVDYQRVLQIKPDDADAAQAVNSVERRLAFNKTVATPFQTNQRLDVAGAPASEVSVADRAVPALPVTDGSIPFVPVTGGGSPVFSISPHSHVRVHASHFHAHSFTRHFLRITAATAFTVLNSTMQSPRVDSCACR